MHHTLDPMLVLNNNFVKPITILMEESESYMEWRCYYICVFTLSQQAQLYPPISIFISLEYLEFQSNIE